MTFDVEMLNCLPIDTFLPILCCRCFIMHFGVVSLTSSIECTLLFRTNEFVMPVPRALMDQIRQIIPPLNGKLHKGQSGQACPPSTRFTPIPITCHRPGRSTRRRSRVTFPYPIDSDNQYSNGIEFQLHRSALLCRNLRTKSCTFRMTGFLSISH